MKAEIPAQLVIAAATRVALEAVAEELEAQADAIDRRIQYHGLGPHGVCARCEAWQVIAGDLRRRAAAIRESLT